MEVGRVRCSRCDKYLLNKSTLATHMYKCHRDPMKKAATEERKRRKTVHDNCDKLLEHLNIVMNVSATMSDQIKKNNVIDIINEGGYTKSVIEALSNQLRDDIIQDTELVEKMRNDLQEQYDALPRGNTSYTIIAPSEASKMTSTAIDAMLKENHYNDKLADYAVKVSEKSRRKMDNKKFIRDVLIDIIVSEMRIMIPTSSSSSSSSSSSITSAYVETPHRTNDISAHRSVAEDKMERILSPQMKVEKAESKMEGVGYVHQKLDQHA